MPIFIAAVTATWVGLLTAAPVMAASGAVWVYLLGSRICHQIAGRSFHLDGAQLPVCARCYGIYAGVAVVAAVWAVAFASARRPWRKRTLDRRNGAALLAVAAFFNLATLAVEWTRWWGVSNAARASAGAALGVALGVVIIAEVSKLYDTPWTPTPLPARDPRSTRT